MRRWFLVTLVMVVLGAPIALARQKVSIDYDRAHDFSRIRSFAMQIATSWGNPLGEKRVLEAVGQALVARGWTRQDGAAADSVDVMVMIHGTTESRRRLNTMYTGGPWRYGGGMGTIEEEEFTVGTLLVDIFDAGSKELLFRGSAEGELATSTERKQKQLEKVVRKMFKDFPPAPQETK